MSRIRVKFTDYIPHDADIEEGCLYISTTYNTTMHKCACGCGALVPLPLSPADWSIRYDGENVSLNPSVGNGALACRSHYYIKNNQIIWLPKLSDAQTHAQQVADNSIAERFINDRSRQMDSTDAASSILSRFKRVLRQITRR